MFVRVAGKWLHSKKDHDQQMIKASYLWQVGLIANVKLHFFIFLNIANLL